MAAELTVGLLAGDDPAESVRSAVSVLNQTWPGELILAIVAGCDRPDLVRDLENLEARDDRISILRRCERNQARSRNAVLRATETPLLTWINPGEVWPPDKLEERFRVLEALQYRGFAMSPFPDCLADGLGGLLGETRAWRRIGNFDETLSCLADEEFLLRLVLPAGSGNVVTPQAMPMAADWVRGCDWRALGAETASVWKRHRSALESTFGRRTAEQYRCRQLLGVAEAATRAGHRGIGALYRARAGALVLKDARATRARLAAAAHRHARAIVRPCLRAGAQAITALRLGPESMWIRGIDTILDSRPVGRLLAAAPAFKALASPGLKGADESAPSPSDRRVLIVAAAAFAAGERTRAVEVLEAYTQNTESRIHPLVAERLARTYLASGDFDRAEDVLRGCLRGAPAAGALHLALVEALCGKSEWEQALMHWENLPCRLREQAGVWAHIGIARAYRHTGRPDEAHRIAQRAAERWPGNPELVEEVACHRPRLIEWERCLVTLGGVSGEQPACVGVVEDPGFLHGEPKPLTGCLTFPSTRPVTVNFRVNGCTVASTVAAPNATGSRFAMNCSALQEYLGDGDVVDIVCDEGPIRLPGGGAAAMVHCGLISRHELLIERLSQGWVFGKHGRFRPGHTVASKRATLEFYERLADLVHENTGQRLFPFYGNLLGAVREGDFISHDVDGFDVLYLCRNDQPESVKREVLAVCALLQREGYHVRLKRASVIVRRRSTDSMFIDLNYGWFSRKGELGVSYGWRGTPARGKEAFLRPRLCRLFDRDVRVPGNAEEVLEQLYGCGWRFPDQGFSAKSRLERDDTYLFTDSDMFSSDLPPVGSTPDRKFEFI